MKLLNWIVILCVVESYAAAQESNKSDNPKEATQTQNQSAKSEDAKPVLIELAQGQIVMTAPKAWKQVEPRFPNMIQYEFKAPVEVKESDTPVRITVMESGGGVQGNLDRWIGQFKQPDGKATKDVAKVEEFEVDGLKIHFVTISGTYSGGMAAGGRPPAPKENYQLIGGIVPTENSGMYFVTAIGPIDETTKLVDGFREMLKNLKLKK